MEVTYRKNLNRSYMCVETQDQVLEEYELQMMQHCRIPELLRVWEAASDRSVRYLYDISGKQQIADYLSGPKLGSELLQKFLFSIQKVCASLPEYLLRESGICLDLSFIYINLENGSIQFTYLPFYEKNFPEAFRDCMEQLLRKIDHQDHLAVELGYQIYQLCVQDRADIRKILESVLKEPYSINEEEEIIWERNQKEKENRVDRAEKEEIQEKHNLKPEPEKGKNHGGWKNKLFTVVGKYMPLLSKISNYLFNGTKEERHCPWKKKNFGIKDKMWLHKKTATREIENPIQVKSMEESVSVVHPTEILTVQENMPLGKLEYQGINKCEDIFVEGESFLLGKNQEQVDGVILADGVSRLHARIIRQEGRYFIEDLNSTNGTFLNDVELEYHQPQELNRNDRVRFGVEEYMFS